MLLSSICSLMHCFHCTLYIKCLVQLKSLLPLSLLLLYFTHLAHVCLFLFLSIFFFFFLTRLLCFSFRSFPVLFSHCLYIFCFALFPPICLCSSVRPELLGIIVIASCYKTEVRSGRDMGRVFLKRKITHFILFQHPCAHIHPCSMPTAACFSCTAQLRKHGCSHLVLLVQRVSLTLPVTDS